MSDDLQGLIYGLLSLPFLQVNKDRAKNKKHAPRLHTAATICPLNKFMTIQMRRNAEKAKPQMAMHFFICCPFE